MANPLEVLQELLTSPKAVTWAEGVQQRMAHPLEAIAQASQEFMKQPVDELASSMMGGGVGSTIHKIGKLKIIENPTREQATNLVKQAPENDMRAFVDPDNGKLFIWNSMDATHPEAMKALGYSMDDYYRISSSTTGYGDGTFYLTGRNLGNDSFPHKIFSGERSSK